MTILYFTATGNSLYVAKSFTFFDGRTLSIPQLLKEGTFEIEDDVIGIVTPVFNLGIPLLVRRYLEQATLKCNYLFAILTYGMISGDAIGILQGTLEKNGNTPHYINELKMVDNYLPGFRVEDELDKLPSKQVHENLDKITDDIDAQRHHIAKKGFFWRKATPPIYKRRMAREKGIAKLHNFDRDFTVHDDCTRCTVCVRICPVGNISLTEEKPTYHHNCEACLACIHGCPVVAIHHAREKSAARFRNESIKAREIIAANNIQEQ